RVDRHLEDRVGPLGGELLDLDAALGGAHGEERAVRAVEQEGEVVLLGDVAGLGDQHAVHGMALDVHAEDRLGLLARLLGCPRQLHAARLAAAAGLDLSLHHDRPAELPRPVGRFGGAVGHRAAGDGYAVRGEDVPGLVLVEVHSAVSRLLLERRRSTVCSMEKVVQKSCALRHPCRTILHTVWKESPWRCRTRDASGRSVTTTAAATAWASPPRC